MLKQSGHRILKIMSVPLANPESKDLSSDFSATGDGLAF